MERDLKAQNQKFPPARFRSGFRRIAGVGGGSGRNPGVRGRPSAVRREKVDVSRVCLWAVRSGVQARPGAPPRGGDRPDGPATVRAAAACPWVRAA